MINAEDLVQDIVCGIISWYSFAEDARILCVAESEDRLISFFREREYDITVIGREYFLAGGNSSTGDQTVVSGVEELSGQFDYVIAIGQIEYCRNPEYMVQCWAKCLNEKGILLLGMNNRLGLRYFCGDRDNFTGRNLDSIENYRYITPEDRKNMEGCNYDRNQVERWLKGTVLDHYRFYSVFPLLEAPQMLIAEDYVPKEDLGVRIFPKYEYPDTVFLDEQYMYSELAQNGMLHSMANAFLIECTQKGCLSNVCQVTLSAERGPEYGMATLIRRNGRVEKAALFREGKKRLEDLLEHGKDLAEHGIHVIDAKIEAGRYCMPYVEGEDAVTALRKLARKDADAFIEKVNCFREIIMQSSEHVQGDCRIYGEGKQGYTLTDNMRSTVIMKRGYVDLVPLNCFFIKEKFIFFDQEFCFENYLANAIILRSIDLLYVGDTELQGIVPKEKFLEAYGLKEEERLWRDYGNRFTAELRNRKTLRIYNERHEPNINTIHSNRQRMNYSGREYMDLFVNIFDGVSGKELILFGSGAFTKHFLTMQGRNYEVSLILDNNVEKWGTELDGIPIVSPECLREKNADAYKVLICIKKYPAVLKQLQNMGVSAVGIYDPDMIYPQTFRRTVSKLTESSTKKMQKKYKVGYVAGVFDMFHIGHLNLLRRAKEQCEYLIVGVVSDEGVRRLKQREPVIPFRERIEIVRACSYVEQAEEIPADYPSIRDAYRMYRFDVQFTGDDHKDNPDWMAEKIFLEKQGADIVYFPYTEGTSSTQLKAMIENKLL